MPAKVIIINDFKSSFKYFLLLISFEISMNFHRDAFKDEKLRIACVTYTTSGRNVFRSSFIRFPPGKSLAMILNIAVYILYIHCIFNSQHLSCIMHAFSKSGYFQIGCMGRYLFQSLAQHMNSL